MIHFPASFLNFPKMSDVEFYNYKIMSKIIKIKDCLKSSNSSMIKLLSTMDSARNFDNFTEENLVAYLNFKSIISSEIVDYNNQISALKNQLK